MSKFDVAIVGTGLVGTALAYDLGTRGASLAVLEKESEPAAGASRSNSGVLHTGFDSKPGEFETAMILARSKRWRSVFDALGVPYRESGALLAAVDENEATHLPRIAQNTARNGLQVELLNGKEAKQLEPRSSAKTGLLVPDESIIDPYEVVHRMLASSPTIELRPGWPGSAIEPDSQSASITSPSGKILCRVRANLLGFFGDEVAGDNSFRIFPRRCEFAVLLANSADLVGRILMPVPHPETKGVLVFPTIYGHLCVGPSAVGHDDKSDWQAHRKVLAFVEERGARLLPEIRNLEQTDSWAGIRPAMYHVAAIRSTGLSSCLDLSGHVTGLLMKRGLSLSSISGKQKHAEPLFEDNPPRPWWERLNELRR